MDVARRQRAVALRVVSALRLRLSSLPTHEHESLAGSEAILAAGTSTAAAAGGGAFATPVAQRPKVNSAVENIGRNDPCWCGSGKKFKKCHGA